MTLLSVTLLAAAATAAAVLPSDRMAMADRLFDRGLYAEAKAEYESLKGADGVESSDLLYRLAETNRLLGNKPSARAYYGELLERHPLSRHAARSRLMRAMAGTPAEQKAELRVLDSDKVPTDIRAAALYHYGVVAEDAAAFAKAVKVAPKGEYAQYARFRHASMTADDPNPAVRRAAVGELMEVFFGKDKALGRDALYLAANKSYSNKSYGEAASLFSRYMKTFPNDARNDAARKMAAWSYYLTGRYSDSAALCGEGASDDAAYLLAACALSTGDAARAKELMLKYLEDYPQGAYRKSVELPLARMDFESAEKGADPTRIVEAAKRSAELSKSSGDRLRLAWAYEKAGRDGEAFTEYTGVAKDFPGTDDAAEAMFRKAMIDVRAGKWSPAELALSEALTTGRNLKRRAEALYWRGIAAVKLGHGAQAAEFLKDALGLGLSLDQTREAELLIADYDYNNGRPAEAKTAYAKLVREGATERMSAAKIRAVGRFMLDCREGASALDEVKVCAKALIAVGSSAEWRQAGYALLGDAESAAGEYSAAAESYRRCLAEAARTDDVSVVALSLGALEARAGNHDAAEKALKEAVGLNAKNARRRAEAYLWLAKNAETAGDISGACAYATVVTSLFDDKELAAEAEKILTAHPEEAK